MKAVQFSDYGGPEVLRVADVVEPHAGPGQVRVAVRGAGVNPVDWKIRSGALRQVMPAELPIIPGSDVAGVVDEVGEGVTDVGIGDEMFGFAVHGAAPEHAVLEHHADKPAGLSWTEAAGLPVAVETAVRTLLVNGAAGGVGLAAAQVAPARGARVIGTAGEGNHEFLHTLGVEPTTFGEGLVERVREIARDGMDTAGRTALPELIEITGSPDRVLTIADFTAAEHGVRVTTGADEPPWYALGQAAALSEAGKLTLPVAQTFAFEQAPGAHRISEAGHVRGKLVLVPNGG